MLSDAKCRNASTEAKICKLADAQGLYLWVYPDGRKYWRLRYWQLGKEKSLSLGVYPDISLKEARDRRDAERKKLNSGLDPSQERKAKKIREMLSAENSFEAIAREWHGKHSRKWSPKYAANLLRRLELDIFPKIGSRPIGDITAPEVLSALRLGWRLPRASRMLLPSCNLPIGHAGQQAALPTCDPSSFLTR